ncbi:60S acidic ribosomal protein P0 [Phakopsora pachyrhizi]|nr:60S acidic ribosomal protein P0 [Phakopsora pachyrhizi]
MGKTREFKENYFNKLKDLMAEFPSAFIVNVDNVGSNQMHQIRQALRGKGVVLMGKNTMVRRAIRNILGDNPQYERILPLVKGNIGFVFTSGDLKEVRDIITANRFAAPAKAGAFAPLDVFVPAGNTGMEPGKTSFFQALGIPQRYDTCIQLNADKKIARGTIEIVSDIKIVAAGSRVGASEATLLNLLKISPFTYGMTAVSIYDNGNVFSPSVLDVDNKTLIDQFLSGIKTIASISLATNYPTVASVPHSLVNSYKNLISIALVRTTCLKALRKLRDYLENPEAFAAAPAAESAAPAAASAEATKEAEPEEDEDEDMGS